MFLGPKTQMLPQKKEIGQIHIFLKKKLFFFYKKHVKTPNNPLQYHFSNFIT